MRKFRPRRPSGSMLVALLALFVALGGSSYAALKITSSNIKNGTIKGLDIHSSTITGSKLKKNTLTGTQINESRLGTVPSATSATNAVNATNATNAGSAANAAKVGGVAVGKIDFRAPASTSATTIFDSGKLKLAASCSAAGALTLTASTSVDHAQIDAWGTNTDFTSQDFLIAGPHDFANQNEQRDLVYTEPGGQTVQVSYLAQGGQTAQGTTKCTVTGFAMTA